MFKATDGYVLMSSDFSQQEQSEFFEVEHWSEVETPDGWKSINHVVSGDILLVTDEADCKVQISVTKKELVDKNHFLIYYQCKE